MAEKKAPFITSDRIKNRLDGTFEIVHDNKPYHVCSFDIDPYNLYSLDEVSAFALANPGLVDVETDKSVAAIRLAESEVVGRQLRNQFLAASDFRLFPDAPGNKNAWTSYRQELRDWPASKDFPDVKSIPVAPQD